jgi:putative DNA methylase
VFPGAAGQRNSWPKATGLAEDVRRYGAWMRDEAEKRIGHLYPKATLDDGSKATVIAWIWARTVTCPNPACGIEMPLVRSWWLGKKKGKEAYVVPSVIDGRVEFSIGHDKRTAPTSTGDGTVGRQGATCVSCAAAIPLEYVRSRSREVGLGSQLMATVAEGTRTRIYLAPTRAQEDAARLARPHDVPAGELFDWPGRINVVRYGLTTFASLFTNRQLTALTTFSDLVGEARERVLRDALASGMPEGERLEQGGTDAAAYADAVATYLGLASSRCADYFSTINTWASAGEFVRNVFSRQALPMAWDFAETNAFSDSTGNFRAQVAWTAGALERVPAGPQAEAVQADAASRSLTGLLISTDPPYYDNIGYSDLSDYFYVWLRRSLRGVNGGLLGTMLVPKAEELVANPYRHGGRAGAEEFFESGFEQIFENARRVADGDYPITVYYAFKQSEVDDQGEASTGWDTILGSMVRAGWSVTATWPVRSEKPGRSVGIGTNALASSIVLALRPRPADAPVIDRKGVLAELRASLATSLRELQQGSIAPVDLAQAAIGPGMSVFSKYLRVVEPSGRDMSVRDALRAINAVLDEVRSEQEGDFDVDTRWCVAWFESHGFDVGSYGDAETLANARNASVTALARGGVLTSGGGKVKLLAPSELPSGYDAASDERISLWEVVLHMARALTDERGGLAAAGRILHGARLRELEPSLAKELVYLLHRAAEKRGMTQAGNLFNELVSSWPEVIAAARDAENAAPRNVTASFDLDGLED